MKKIFFMFLGIAVISFTPLIASAETNQKTPADFTKDTIKNYNEISLYNLKNFTKVVDKNLNMIMADGYFEIFSEDVKKHLTEKFRNENIYLIEFGLDAESNVYIFADSKENYEKYFINGEQNTDNISTHDYISGHVIIGTPGEVEEYKNNYYCEAGCTGVLSANPQYQKYLAGKENGSFFNTFFTKEVEIIYTLFPLALTGEDAAQTAEKLLLEMNEIKQTPDQPYDYDNGGFFTASQNGNEIRVKLFEELPEVSLKEPLEIQNLIPIKDPIFTTIINFKNYQVYINNLIYDEDFQEIKEIISNSEFLISIENSGKLIPYFTFALKFPETERENFNIFLENTIDQMWNDLKTSATFSSNSKIITQNGSSIYIFNKSKPQKNFYNFEISLQGNKNNNIYYPKNLGKLLKTKILVGTTDKNTLIISNKEDILSAEISKNKNISDNTTFYFAADSQNTMNYLIKALEIIGKKTNPLIFSGEKLKAELEKYHSIYGLLYYKTEVDGTSKITSSGIELDPEKLADLFDFDNFEYIHNDLVENEIENLEYLTRTFDDFDDVPADEWYSEPVYYLYVKNLVDRHEYFGEGDKSSKSVFRPNDNINRAEFAILISKFLTAKGYEENISIYQEKMPYQDVNIKDHNWIIGHLNGLQNLGILAKKDMFYPDQPISRAEAAQILSNIIDKYNLAKDQKFMDLAKLKDISQKDWFYQAVKKVAENGVMKGGEYKFRPKNNLTRAEAATIIYNMYVY